MYSSLMHLMTRNKHVVTCNVRVFLCQSNHILSQTNEGMNMIGVIVFSIILGVIMSLHPKVSRCFVIARNHGNRRW